MVHMIQKTDGLVLARVPAWHGLGTVVDEAPTVVEALSIANLGWMVEKRELWHPSTQSTEQGSFVPVRDYVVTVRSDTGEQLGVVGNGYKVLQNQELAEMIDALAAEGVQAKVETAGSLRGGRDVFFLIQSGAIELGKRDVVSLYHLFANTHDGSSGFTLLPTSVRVVCKNTLNAVRGEKGRRIVVRHTGDMRARVKEAIRAMRASDESLATFTGDVKRLASVKVDQEDVKNFFLDVYSKAYGAIPKAVDEEGKRRRDKALKTVAAWVDNLDSPLNSGTGTEGTVWHALNAVTQWADHDRTIRNTENSGGAKAARDFSNLFGSSADFKAKALESALALAR